MFDQLSAIGYDIVSTYHAESLLDVEFKEAHDQIELVMLEFSISAAELVAGGGGETEFTQRLRRALADKGWDKQNLLVEKRLLKFVGKIGSDSYEKQSEDTIQSLSHEIDHVKSFQAGTILLEIEWNNKDPFFDRDLENFKRLHGDGAASMGIIITRGASLQNDMVDIITRYGREHQLSSEEALLHHGLEPTKRQLELYKKAAARFDDDYVRGWAKAFVSDKFGTATTHWSKLTDRIARGVGNPCPLVAIGIPSSVITF